MHSHIHRKRAHTHTHIYICTPPFKENNTIVMMMMMMIMILASLLSFPKHTLNCIDELGSVDMQVFYKTLHMSTTKPTHPSICINVDE